MTFVLASQSAVKVGAFMEALIATRIDAELMSVKASSGIDEQPLGHDVTLLGARQRAKHAAELVLTGDVYFAIENGIFREGTQFVDRAVVLLRAADGREWVELSQGVCIPPEYVAKSVASNLTITASTFMAQEGVVRQHDDPHQDLDLIEMPGLRKSRLVILRETIIRGLESVKIDWGL